MRTAKHESKFEMNLMQKIIVFAALLLAPLFTLHDVEPSFDPHTVPIAARDLFYLNAYSPLDKRVADLILRLAVTFLRGL